MGVSTFVGKLLEEGLAQHEPEPVGRGATLMLGPVHGKGRSTFTRGMASFPVSTCRFRGPAFVLLRPIWE
jgi:hypothetical protein